MSDTPKKYDFPRRRIGRTGLELPALGIGSGSLAGNMVYVSPEDARATVARALDSGVTYLDTAPQYGHGRAEHFVGDVLRYRQEGIVLSTKVGGLLKPVRTDAERTWKHHTWAEPFPFDLIYDYSYDGIRRSFEDSLQRLALSHVDILYVHDLGTMTHGAKNAEHWQAFTAGGGFKALQELKANGSIQAIGMGVNEHQILLDVMELGDWDLFLLAGRYTLLEQGSLDFLETCLKRNVGIVLGGPFNGGALMGTGTWNYAKAPQEIIDRVHRLESFCKEQGVPIGAAALQFPTAHPAVKTVLPGPKSPAELDGIIEWWQFEIPGSFWDALADQKLVAPGTPLPNGRTA
jgi:D-threo-aldose 1-dehydrogenase